MRKSRDKVGEIWQEILPLTDDLYDHEKDFFSELVSIGKRSKRILEIGTGRGRMVKLLKRAGVNKKKTFYGIDLNPICDQQDIMFCLSDTRKLSFKDNVFDLTYSLGVVEHMSCKETFMAIEEHKRVTRPGGYILITTPAKSFIFTPLRYVVYFLKYRGMGSFREVLGRNLTEADLIKDFSKDEQYELLKMGRGGFYFPKLPSSLRKKVMELMPSCVGAYLWILIKKK